MRSRADSSREYEGAWSRVLSIVERQIAGGERDALQIIERVGGEISEGILAERGFRTYYERLKIPRGDHGLPLERVVVRDGAYRLIPYGESTDRIAPPTLVEYLIGHAGSVDCVVELGSGYGRNLFALHAALGGQRGMSLEMHACELTAAGRRATERLREVVDGIDLSVHPFDYYEPNLSFLAAGRNVVFFTSHSIEQIPTLPRAIVDEMLARTDGCTCFHFEPVGWQHDPGLAAWRNGMDGATARLRRWALKRPHRLARSIDRVFGTRLHRGFAGIRLTREDLGREERVSHNAALWSARQNYNKNLVGLLQTLEHEGRITIDRREMNVSGSNPFNPTSVLAWSKRRGEAGAGTVAAG